MKNFRLLMYLFMAVLLVPLASCDDDDDDEPSKKAMLTAGTWTAESVKVDDNLLTKEQILLLTGEDISTWTVTFNNDNTGTLNVFGETSTGEWRFEDNEQTIVFGTGSDESRAKINRLTDSELYLEFSVEDLEDEDLENFGETFEIRFIR